MCKKEEDSWDGLVTAVVIDFVVFICLDDSLITRLDGLE
jgi:hypothetical protein